MFLETFRVSVFADVGETRPDKIFNVLPRYNRGQKAAGLNSATPTSKKVL